MKFDAGAKVGLEQLFGDDFEQYETFQEWVGYLLVNDTALQKMLLIIGPRRSGKGTLARVTARLVGAGNVAGPTTSSLAGPFGLQPLIGKSLAIVSDARFTGENIGIVVERLICISGEDTLTVDQKFKASTTMKLAVRFMFLSNELPKMNDASGAMAGRFIVLRLTRSFYGKEDPGLTDALMEELPGILQWAIEGLKRLRKRGHFIQPKSVADAISEMEDLASRSAHLYASAAKSDRVRANRLRSYSRRGNIGASSKTGNVREALRPSVATSAPRLRALRPSKLAAMGTSVTHPSLLSGSMRGFASPRQPKTALSLQKCRNQRKGATDMQTKSAQSVTQCHALFPINYRGRAGDAHTSANAYVVEGENQKLINRKARVTPRDRLNHLPAGTTGRIERIMTIKNEDRNLFRKLSKLENAIGELLIDFVMENRTDPDFKRHDAAIAKGLNQISSVKLSSMLGGETVHTPWGPITVSLDDYEDEIKTKMRAFKDACYQGRVPGFPNNPPRRLGSENRSVSDMGLAIAD